MSGRYSYSSGGGGSIDSGTYATATVTPAVGDTWLCSDSGLTRRCLTAGVWTDVYAPAGGIVTPPQVADYTAINASGSTKAQAGHAKFLCTRNNAGYQLRSWTKPISDDTRYKGYSDWASFGDSGFGPLFYKAASTVAWHPMVRLGVFEVRNWTGHTGLSGPLGATSNTASPDSLRWIEIWNDTSNSLVHVRYGSDRDNFSVDFVPTAYANFGGDGLGPDEVGFGGYAYNTYTEAVGNAAAVYHIEETSTA